MLVGVCDFPSTYQFPPVGYEGIERWLWAVGVGAQAAGADVHTVSSGNRYVAVTARITDTGISEASR
ncbi:hypothetical protein [Myceligenerans xiligouense]|uniref:Uncharacterized protein n=1 Tax=Myceligenerans xiligouense TaxID=253184 RepID=A0A3N4ZHL2_9MICO|nr:hypothetical protein [Myceligenerans xiligouense]RPF20355.1 hypothetical protein EDD34_0944 [Myceligenerans xiligouense]